jgi:hypothetical protein
VRVRLRGAAETLPALLPGVLVAVLAFQAGGFFPDSYGLVAAALAVLLAIYVTVSRRPAAGLSVTGAIALTGLALFALWALISARWSQAPGRALVEYTRTLLYVLALALSALPAAREGKLAWGVRATALGMAVVAGAALLSRLEPDLVHGGGAGRLSWPLTYWNGLGCLLSAAIVLTLHLAASEKEPWPVRLLAGAALPALAVTLFLTLSRGGIAAGVLGCVIYVLFGRPPGLPGAAIAVLPTAALAVRAANAKPVLTDGASTHAQLVAAGHPVARSLVLAMAAAIVLRAVTLPLDTRLARVKLRIPWPVPVAAVAVVAIAFVVAGGVGVAHRQADHFLHGGAVDTAAGSNRLLSVSDNNRTEHWRVALVAFRKHPLDGSGAGTYEESWGRYRRLNFHVLNAHSLYLQVLGELGVVGIVPLLAALLALAAGLLLRARGPARPQYIAVFAAFSVWAVHAGVDWDWELTSVSVWVFSLGGIALAAAPREGRASLHPTVRVVIALGCLFIGVQPALLWRSQARLATAVQAYQRGDCRTASDAALDSLDAVGSRSDPWELLAICDSRAGQSALAIRAARESIKGDPRFWEYHYTLALVQAAAGQDPRPEAKKAYLLNPVEYLPRHGFEILAGTTPAQWRKQVAELSAPGA